MNLYTSLQIKGADLHMTWDFNPGKCRLPNGVIEDQESKVKIIGEYSDKDCSCYIVTWEDVTHQPHSITLLHLTTSTSNGVTPYELGQRATKTKMNHSAL